MEDLLSRELPELETMIEALGQPRFRARQIFQWIHAKGVFQVDGMENLPLDLRKELERSLPPFPVALDEVVLGRDGTEKFRFQLLDGGFIESVLIPEGKRVALCVSTQLGCRMGCRICRTGKMGWERNLRAEEMLGQYYAVRARLGDGKTISHVVFMGMGEPLDNLEATVRALRIMTHPLGCNLSPRRITVSTVGIAENLELLLREVPVSITLSLNAADNETRDWLMPINKRYPIERVLDTLRGLPLARRRRFTIAYVLLQGVNDRQKDARNLVRLLHGMRCKINLIPFNTFEGADLDRPDEAHVMEFQNMLRSKGLSTHIRQSRGGDVLAACGQLAGCQTPGSLTDRGVVEDP